MKKLLILAAVTAFTIAACGGGSPSHTKGDAAGAITAAEHQYNRAKKKNFAWRDTPKLIKKAKKALKAGDFDKAVKLAKKAKKQSTDALSQAMAANKAGPHK